MQHQPFHIDRTARLARELERERQQHVAMRESKAGFNLSDSDRLKDARGNFESIKVRR